MGKAIQNNGVNRIIDANINRAKEGLRVCEEVARFILNNRRLAAELKALRHSLDAAARKLIRLNEALASRDSAKDVGENIYANELSRKNFREIYFANLQRVKESIRVLEEFSKLKDKKAAIGFKKIRYLAYAIEKKSAPVNCARS